MGRGAVHYRPLSLFLHAGSFDKFSAVRQKNIIRRIDQVTYEVFSSPAQTRTGHHASSLRTLYLHRLHSFTVS